MSAANESHVWPLDWARCNKVDWKLDFDDMKKFIAANAQKQVRDLPWTKFAEVCTWIIFHEIDAHRVDDLMESVMFLDKNGRSAIHQHQLARITETFPATTTIRDVQEAIDGFVHEIEARGSNMMRSMYPKTHEQSVVYTSKDSIRWHRDFSKKRDAELRVYIPVLFVIPS